ncbi:MAG TPA: hypothetical protein VLX92_09255, partial [Kofleriaceae bacterium]|nr:hypothetical protein [Kofleriaceae bacterium]
MTALAARARGLGTTVLAGEALAAIELARDREQLVAALAHAGVPADASPDAVDRCARDRVARDLATLARWSSALALIELDEDRRSLRALVRGLAAGTGAGRRSAAAIATSSLPAGELAELAALPTIDALAERLARRGHPLAGALLVPHRAAAPIDVLAIEIALARGFTAAAARAHVRDRALGAYLAQVIDAENAAAALLLAERGAGLSAEHAFV